MGYVQDHLRAMETDPIDAAIGIGTFSRCLSAPAKRFARAMGVADGTLALLEYAASSDDSSASSFSTTANEALLGVDPPGCATHFSAPPSSPSSCGSFEQQFVEGSPCLAH